jgi:RimJ/RimL family protein N-acetyltransferase
MNDVVLRALEPEDYRVTHNWRLNDDASDTIVGLKRYVSLETEKNWILQAISNHENGKVFRFVICMEGEHKAVGLVTVSDIDLINKSCSIANMVDPGCPGLGLGRKGLIMVIKYMMENLGIQRVSCKILEYNIASRKSVSKVGMKEEGVLRQAIYKNGKFHNIVCYSILKDEFEPLGV